MEETFDFADNVLGIMVTEEIDSKKTEGNPLAAQGASKTQFLGKSVPKGAVLQRYLCEGFRENACFSLFLFRCLSKIRPCFRFGIPPHYHGD